MPRLPLVLLALALAVAPALAQGVGGGVTARFEPGTLTLAVGDAGGADLIVRNEGLQPATVTLSVTNARSLVLTLSKADLLLAPGATETVRVGVYPAPSLGAVSLAASVVLTEAGTPLAPAKNTTVTLPVHVIARAAPAPAARLSPASFPDTSAPVGGNATLDTNVSHADASNRSYLVGAILPPGWTLAGPAGVNVEPNASTLLRVQLSPSDQAASGPARLLLALSTDPSVVRIADVWLAQASKPSGNETRNETRNGTMANETRPPADPATPPPANETTSTPPAPTPEGDEDAPPIDDASAAPPPPAHEAGAPQDAPPAPPRLEVVPGSLTLSPGGTASATLRVTSDADRDAIVALELPPGLGSDLTQRVIPLRAGTTFEVPFIVEADVGLANGTILAGILRLDEGAQIVTFEVLILQPVPPIELASVPTAPPPGSGDLGTGRGLALSALAAGVGAGALAILWTGRRWAPALLGLYARMRPQTILEHPVRQRMMDVVLAQPGLTMRELQRELGLANGATMHHLRALEKAGIVRVVPDGMLRRLYPVGHARVDPVPALADRVLRVVQEQGETTPAHVAAAVGATRQAVHYHLQKMIRDGRLHAREEDGETLLRVPERGPSSRSASA